MALRGAFHQKKTDLQIEEDWDCFSVEFLVKKNLSQLLKGRGIEVQKLFGNIKALSDTDGYHRPKAEFDMAAASDKEVVIVGVATCLSPQSIHYFLSNLRKFKPNFPKYKKEILYGAVAYFKSEGQAHVLAEKEGLFVIKAVGDSASLINKPDFKPKAFA